LADTGEHRRQRILALDVGKKRIGLAVSDELGMTALGLQTLQRTRIREDIEQLRETAVRYEVGTLLVGHPLHMSGDESRQGAYTKEFAERLASAAGLPVVYWDERLTSAEAERLMRQAGATLEQRKRAVDQMAAVLLLESYMGYRRGIEEADTGFPLDLGD
jgi:putative Holliday junction resolvase